MYFKEKSIEEWQKILKGLKSISTEASENKGYVDDNKFFRETITSLEFVLKGSSALSKNIDKVLNLFNEHHYYDIKSGLDMLKSINCYDLNGLSKNIKIVSEKSGLTGIALYSENDKEFEERSTFINKGGYKRFFFPNDNFKPSECVNLFSNGENNIYLGGIDENLIEDARSFNSTSRDYNYRLLWTTDFDFSLDFPSKSTLDMIDFELESKKQFAKILYSLKLFRAQGRVQIIFSNPNQMFQCQENNYNNLTHNLNGTYFNTIRADGRILNDEGNTLWPTSRISIKNDNLSVKDSNYVLLATNSEKLIEEEPEYTTEYVTIIVDPNWYYSFIDYAIKNNLVDAETIVEFSSCVNTETKKPINSKYKVEITPTLASTLSLIKKPKIKQ